jgi:hypothetical protein
MKIKFGELRKIIREALNETRPWGREVGAEWDEPDGAKWDRIEYYRQKKRAAAKKKADALAKLKQMSTPSAEPEKKNELDETDGWFDNLMSKIKKLAMTDVGGPEGFLSPSDKAARHGKTKSGPSDDFRKWQEKRNKKQEVSETGAYYGKVAPARGAIMGGNDQKDPAMVRSCGYPGCPGCEEDYSDWEGPADIGEQPVMCWCGDRDCSHYE